MNIDNSQNKLSLHKRGRKSIAEKAKLLELEQIAAEKFKQLPKEEQERQLLEQEQSKLPKKRGRKPKQYNASTMNLFTHNNNNNKQCIIQKPIILNLKCKFSDINNENSIFNNNTNTNNNINNTNNTNNTNNNNNNINNNIKISGNTNTIISTRQKNQLLSNDNLEFNKNNIHYESNCINSTLNTSVLNILYSDSFKLINEHKKSNCFFCTCEFNNDPIYIPYSHINNKYNVYGNFCTVNCAAGFLFNIETIDTSILYERYYLLNQLYKRINNNGNIKCAPNPYYTLDKYFGNLSIEEYRQLLNQDDVVSVITEPICKIISEAKPLSYNMNISSV